MGCRGVLFAIDAETEKRFRAARKRDVMAIVEELEALGDEYACETDVVWDAIHLALVDGATTRAERKLVELAITGGKRLYKGDNIVHLVTADEVTRLAPVLARIDNDLFSRRFAQIKQRAWMPSSGFGPHGLDHALEYFPGIRDFYSRAAAAGRAVVFTASQ